jgi:HK97 family phage portal protein
VPRALWPLPSQRVKIIPGNPKAGEPLIKAYEVDWGLGDAQVIPEADIVQLKHPNPQDPYFYGSSLVMWAAAEIDLDWFITNHQREFFKNDATPAGIVTFPQVLNPDVRKAFEENWLQKFRRKPGETGYLEGGATYTSIMNQKELDYIQSAGVNIKKVQSVTGVPDSKLMLEENIQARATLETLDYNFQKETIEPLLTLIDEQLTMDLAKSEFDERLTVRHESVIPKDIRLQAEMDEAELRMGKASINEVRERSGYEPIPGGEEPLVSVGLIPLSRVLEEVQSEDPPTQQDAADDQALSAAVAAHRGELEAAGKRLACLFRSGARPTALALAAVPMIHLGFSAHTEAKATMEQTRRALRGVHLALERIRADRRSADLEKGKRLAITAFSAGLTIAHHDHRARRAS